jgi:hypothetical protein
VLVHLRSLLGEALMGWARSRDRKTHGGPVHGAGDLDIVGADPFWSSPVGDAARARLRGDRFFQIELDHETLATYAAGSTVDGRTHRSNGATDLLGQIEQLGWSLEHVAWWNLPGAMAETVRVHGIYLFRATDDDTEEVGAPDASRPNTHAPSHRREAAL